MKGFKNSTRTQSGHGYDEVPTRPATSKDVAAAKAVRIITPGKSTPRVTDSMILGKGEDKAPGERGGKKFAVGGMVPPRSGGMPALGKPLTAQNMNDARLAPPRPAPRPKIMPVASRAPLIKSVSKPAERMTPPPATSNYEPGGNPPDPYGGPKMSMADMAKTIKSVNDPNQPKGELVSKIAMDAIPYDEMSAARSTGALARLSADRGYKKGGKVVEKGSKEVYASKAAMKKHEASESKSKERSEHAGYAKGGKSKWC